MNKIDPDKLVEDIVSDEEGLDSSLEPIAIIGMAGRFPQADDVESFWENIRSGKESIQFFSDEELREAGVKESLLQDSNYVKASAKLKDAEMFDAAFFGFTPREAKLMDPQHRIFLECAWHSLENAGIDTQRSDAVVGVFSGTNIDNYLFEYFNEGEFSTASSYEKRLSSDNGFLATRVAYKLNLKGPAMTIQTACSTSLVAINVACQNLMTYQCDIALAGASSVQAPRKCGYLYQQHGISSPDGHCRSFDEDSKGTVAGEGVATVVLKRLEDAVADGDMIHAVIKGWAINNDGDAKVGFTAPSVDGQAEVIEMAQMLAGINADSIGYVEAHGTATELGDPIEVAALTQAFSATTDKKNYCALGSVKANIGHLDATAGIAGLIKASLILKNKIIPPLVHFKKPNPKINFKDSPFYIATETRPWVESNTPRRAGISSFGMGGTNAHAVLEEHQDIRVSGSSRSHYLFVVSARNKNQCAQAVKNMSEWINKHPEQSMADAAYTLQTGRRRFDHAAIMVSADTAGQLAKNDSAVNVLQDFHPGKKYSAKPECAFMFPGQGNQYINMAANLYQCESVFREIVDTCNDIIMTEFDYDLTQILYPTEAQDTSAAEKLTQTQFAQPALFTVEYALARQLMSWGVQPQALIGHSIGEYVAACLAGVFSLAEAIKLVAHRGRLMQSVESGSMAAIPLSAEELKTRLPDNLCIAVINEPGMCVISGVSEDVNVFVERCEVEGLRCYPLHTSHAFHSSMMNSILDAFATEMGKVKLSPPLIPFLSNVTGDWITDQQAMDPQYWVKHIRHTVMFNDGLQVLLMQKSRLLYEVGPGNSLASIALRHQHRQPEQMVVSAMRHIREMRNDQAVLLESLGQVWMAGIDINWDAFYKDEIRLKIELPGYPFERKPFWIKAGSRHSADTQSQLTEQQNNHQHIDQNTHSIDDWFYVPSWQRQIALSEMSSPQMKASDNLKIAAKNAPKNWLIFVDETGLSDSVIAHLQKQGDRIITVMQGKSFAIDTTDSYLVSADEADYSSLYQEIEKTTTVFEGVLYMWSLGELEKSLLSALDVGFNVPMILVKALNQFIEKNGKQSALTKLWFVSDGIQQVTGEEMLSPLKAMLLGVNTVCTQEMPAIYSQSIDFSVLPTGIDDAEKYRTQRCNHLLAEIAHPIATGKISPYREIVYRGSYRWIKTIESITIENPNEKNLLSTESPARPPDLITRRLKHEGVYLISGGFGGIGRVLAEYLAENYKARLILTGRSELPNNDNWDDWLSEHGDSEATSKKILFIRRLQQKGAMVITGSCDIADSVAMSRLVEQATVTFGEINGVIHSAGVPAGGLIQLKSKESAAEILAPKVQGALVLDKLFDNKQLDFMLLCSSLAAITGGIGQVDYTAANIFLDTLAMSRLQKGLYTVSINWDTWGETGMAVDVEVPAEYQAQKLKNLQSAIRSQEGIEVFLRVLNLTLPQVVISTRKNLNRVAEIFQANGRHDDEDRSGVEIDLSEKDKQTVESERSEALVNDYVSPGNKIESTVCAIWQDMFGIEQIGINDSFFELGGHSLLAIQILSRINETLDTNISLNDFFDAVTISKLAVQMNQDDVTDPENNENADELVDALSDEEVTRLLAEKGVE